MPINPISGPSPAALTGIVPNAGGGKDSPAKTSFGEMLNAAVKRVDSDQQASAAAIRDLLTGKSEDTLPMITAVAKADMSFKLLMGVRNKVIEAYKQTMNMQL